MLLSRDNPSIQDRSKTPLIKYTNSYKMEPDAKFPIRKVEKIAKEILQVRI